MKSNYLTTRAMMNIILVMEVYLGFRLMDASGPSGTKTSGEVNTAGIKDSSGKFHGNFLRGLFPLKSGILINC